MVRRAIAGTAIAAAVGLALSGCGPNSTGQDNGQLPQPSSDTISQPTVEPAAVAWANQVCRAIQSQAGKLANLPAPTAQQPSPKRLKQAMLSYLGTLADIFANVSKKIEQAGPPPVEGVNGLVEQTIEDLNATQQTLQRIRAEVQQLSASDPATFTKTFQQITKKLQDVTGAQEATRNLRTSPKLADAFNQAKTCS